MLAAARRVRLLARAVALGGLVAAISGLLAPLRASDPAAITQAELTRRTQQLLDAFAPGDHAPWSQYLADDALFFDEQGHSMDKKAFLAQLQPLPSGYSGTIRIDAVKSLFASGVAILSYDAMETETVFATVLHARYHMTDTWLYRNQVWQIAASQTLRYYEDPAAGHVTSTTLEDYVGTYQLAPGTVLKVTRVGAELYAQRGDTQPYKLVPESPDVFFRPSVEGRRFFHRDASGHVDMLIDRRNNEDLVWKRIG